MPHISKRWLRRYLWRWLVLLAGCAIVLAVLLLGLGKLFSQPDRQPTTAEVPGSTAALHRDERSAVIIDNGDVLHAHVAYPVTGLANIDRIIEQWANQTYRQALEQAGQTNSSDAAELNVTFQTFRAPDDLTGIEFRVFSSSSDMAHPNETATTFTIDQRDGQLLEADQIVSAKGKEILVKAVAKQVAELGNKTLADEVDISWLDKIVPMQNSLGVLLDQGAKLPSSSGLTRLELPYTEIASALLRPSPSKLSTSQTANSPTSDPESNQPTEDIDAAINNLPPRSIDPNKPMIALTFDDGPGDLSAPILQALNEVGGRATFFVVGNRVDQYAKQAAALTAQGSQVAGHTWDHRDLTNLSAKEVTNELAKTAKAIKQATGQTTPFFRPSYGAINKTVKQVAKQQGLAMINWSVDTEDWKTKNAKAVRKAIVNGAKNGAIILCHDIYQTTVDGAAQAIKDLSQQGYQLVTITELLNARGESLKPGEVYYGQY
ncbi:MAG: polysaccharide deacetylase family protein [Bifidobacteriaceae bacterium]|jgi:peptidoglycan/xylan/chitin deacetylase (PgdA/CDA1 family)|nr:polysaccharide deacetylase family protein [Bifidobacteriaceae bacterium]